MDTMLRGAPFAAVFFDLDGTLADSARDLIVALDRLRAERGEPPCDAQALTRVVSRGARGMLRAAWPEIDEASIDARLPRFLELYGQAIAVHTRLYPGMDEVLTALEARRIAWGIVTNKSEALARRVVRELRLDARSIAIVGGDTLPKRKPDPDTLLHAAALAGVEPARCAYVGDDVRDILAGRNARMATIAAGWGYLNGEDPQDWQADAVAAAPRDLLPLLGLI